jgi:acyl-CoA dehydrogenase
MIRDPEILNDLLDTISRCVQERLVPLGAQVADEDTIPDHVVEEMKAMGLFGLTIPEEYGGVGLTMKEVVLVAIELGRTSPAFRSLFGTNYAGSATIVLDGTPEQKEQYLPS